MEAKIRVIDVDYRIEDNKPVVRIFGKTDEGENILLNDRDFRPYFYAIADGDTEELEDEIEEKEFSEDGQRLPVTGIEQVSRIDGNREIEALKVHTTVPPNIPKLRKNVSQLESVADTREFDIPFYKRYL
ncbi:MAG: hypothetical protein BRC26_03445, partial [Nanohaloarchaea archaeon QH_8_44_6]